MRAAGLAGVVLAFGLSVGSASADPVPFFYLVPTGPTTVPAVVPVGTSTYQLWVDPSGATQPSGCIAPINGGCSGVWGLNSVIFLPNVLPGDTSLNIVGATPVRTAPAYSTFGLICLNTYCGVGAELGAEIQQTGDPNRGNDAPFEIGTITISNTGRGPGDITLAPGGAQLLPIYTDTNLNDHTVTYPQTIAVAAPEPGTLLLLGAGLSGVATVVRARRLRVR